MQTTGGLGKLRLALAGLSAALLMMGLLSAGLLLKVWPLLPLGLILSQLLGMGDPYGPSHALMRGSFATMTIALTLLLVCPVAALCWVTAGRLSAWLGEAAAFQQTPDNRGQLQRRARALSLPLNTACALLAGTLLVLLPVLQTDRAPAISIQSALQTTIIAQQTPMLQLGLLGLVSAAAALWLSRRAVQTLTHELDPQRSEISRLLARRQAAGQQPAGVR